VIFIFSSSYGDNRFVPFSFEHFIILFVFIIGAVLLFLGRNKLNQKVIRFSFFIIMFSLETGYHIWLISSKSWDLASSLPLQLCSISLVLCLLLLLTNKKIIFEIVYFTGIAGAIQAIVTPELFFNFPHFRFFQFFINHILIIWTCLFYVWSVGYKPTIFSFIKAFLFLNVVACFAFFTNKFTGGNYMFLNSKPSNGSAMDFLGPYPWYILSLEGVAIFLFLILLLPFYIKKSRN
jgi:hypothetical integral membrane protein (TIGR02206 family)